MSLQPPPADPRVKPVLKALALMSVNISANPLHVGNVSTATFNVNAGMTIIRGSESERARQVHLKLDVLPVSDSSRTPYIGHVQTMAEIAFAPGEDVAAEMLDLVSAWTAASALIGFARAQLDQITAIGPFNRLLVQLVAIAPIVENATVIEKDNATPRKLIPPAEKPPA